MIDCSPSERLTTTQAFWFLCFCLSTFHGIVEVQCNAMVVIVFCTVVCFSLQYFCIPMFFTAPRWFNCMIVIVYLQPSKVNTEAEWSSVCTRPRPFDPYLMPIPIRMGRAEKGSITPPAIGNLELMKVHTWFMRLHVFIFFKLPETSELKPDTSWSFIQIPNFFHLTPLHIQKHCEALKRKWWVIGVNQILTWDYARLCTLCPHSSVYSMAKQITQSAFENRDP